MNSLKCAFGVTSGKFLDFIVRHRGIEIDQSKIDAIQKMSRPKSLHDLKKRSIDALLTQEKEKGKERALYYLSKTLVGAKVNYSPIEKMCLALFFAIDKLRDYMQAFTVHLVVKADPIKYVLSRPIISGRLAKWVVLLQQYDIVYISQKAIKGQVLASFLADHPIPSDWKLSRRSGAGAGIVLISLEKYMLPYSFALAEQCSNNVAEYQALIIGLQMALEIGVSLIEIYGDSKLIINQLSLQYDVKHEDLKPYFAYAR
ncbi:uncharacterized protein E5676_scaffold306G003230 [Cucumis melo var. makuwa]|uniref:RNase H type-1 domain-containing protein n=1 Tax=Cucumis melo var. makuwa TaxID=1194695 RepID=A0A5A7TGW1_CUCMM|nr:uncharacterized protein E6C27_scaffold67G005300 [Cucumis melo var. makuwa]TYK18010.1 uncharacterized protein E5676_scaffold306G003230 [Cucumis melo var. makuwa]